MTGETARVGTVTEFDEAVGLGQIEVEGGSTFMFHCTQIADGTRNIPVGVRVTFSVVPGRHGRWEAAAVRPTP